MPLTKVKLPTLALEMEEAVVVEWLCDVGARVRKDELLLTVDIDKGSVDVPSPVAGVVAELLVQPGDAVKVGQHVAVLEVAEQ